MPGRRDSPGGEGLCPAPGNGTVQIGSTRKDERLRMTPIRIYCVNPQDVGGEKSRDPFVSRPVRAVNFGYQSSAESPSPSRSLARCATMTSELLSLSR